MKIRRHELAEPFGVSPERMFEILITPSAIRDWYGASKVVVEARKGGSWITSWGESDKDFEHVNSFEILEFDPPRRMLFGSGKYFVEDRWPIVTDITTDLLIEPQPAGCLFRIIQELDPADPLLDDYFDACIAGWQNAFDGIRNYIHANPSD
jgi:hypothetical protein